MMLNAFRYLNISSFLEFERLTISEYNFLMKAEALKRLDRTEEIYQQAWVNWQVQATKTQGKKEVPVYQRFDKFFNKEEQENAILGKKKEKVQDDNNLVELLKMANK